MSGPKRNVLPKAVDVELIGHRGSVHCIRYNIQGEYCFSGGQDRQIKLWNPTSGKCIKTYEGHGWEVLDISIASDNSKFTSCGGDKSAFLWDVTTGHIIRKFSGHFHRINCVDFNFDATVIASGSYDASVRLWDCRSSGRHPIQILDEAKDSVSSLQIKNHEIVTGSIDGNIRVYDLRKGELRTDTVAQPVTSVCFSNDENCILASTLDDVIRLFDKESGTLLNDFKGHVNHDYKIQSTLTNTDAYVVSGSEDGTIHIWDLLEGRSAAVLRKHTKVVTSISYHPKVSKLLSASVDGSIYQWE
ncbi:WD40 repeat-like protein [Basidiobolus meristosporus CBS 931.73]|uniref:WD40 repeat-like protein n=1 Tax=Basidiobolus meristosporus CBS 931.73 TaxID=1314790 RepID=A0A1Y1Z7R4_9FUNG|nr:WD40 repeat-like protein [Basidiobolus meristosporus CBS 931.73]|eukprot:ORY06319.1 WD40 repeat-like protein [Basidiobolus meristosporus CBS 931.73]